MPRLLLISLLLCCGLLHAQDASKKPAMRGSIIEDRAARKLLDAGDLRAEADETDKAVEIWQSVIERYPRSRVRFDAHMRLGNFLLEKQRAFDKARGHFEAASSEDNPDEEKRAEATLNTGICFYENRHYGKCFTIMRQIIEDFPASGHVNSAYYYIGLGHFKLGHYSRAIAALERVGTALSTQDLRIEKVEAGRRLYIKIDDKDLAILEPGQPVKVICKTTSGDSEVVDCLPVGRNVRMALGSIPTTLGKGTPDNGQLEVKGGDQIEVLYTDEHTAEKKFNQKRLKRVQVVGNASIHIMDGSFRETLGGVVLGKGANLQVADADFDRSGKADTLQASAEIWRRKTLDEIENEKAERAAKETPPEEKLNLYKRLDQLPLTFTESEAHSGTFRSSAPLQNSSESIAGDDKLQARPGDLLRLAYLDEVNITNVPRALISEAKCIEGNLGDVRVTKSKISDEELRLRTKLKTASALTHIGSHYSEFGLEDKAKLKYNEALQVCEEIYEDARKVGGSLLEQTYVQLWRIYFAMDELNLALAMSQRLQREFPNSTFVDEAILQQAHVARKKGDLPRAISLYSNLVKLQESPLKGEGQFGIGECYEEMASKAKAEQAAPLYERAFEAYKRVYEQFPDSGRVGDAVAKMANFYYQRKDYARAIDVFENVLDEHPDANFLDVILFNYGRCLYRLERKAEARKKFDILISDFPESPLATEAKKITEALARATK
ncbi:MAG: tetratricopeptide (TPR) repeat protein [Verrucomicrobiales bacterium]|jgi:tetratricopeptide (TPR) repeat protein